MLSLAVDHGAREKLRRMSRDYAERRWSWTATAAEYLRVYQSAVVQPDGAIA